jgi:spore coat protein U-like protein
MRFFVFLLALAALPATVCAQNFTVTSVMPVRIELVGFCNVAASDLDFGAYASNQIAPVNGQTIIQLQCSSGTVAEIALDAGTGPGRNTKRRKLEQDNGTDQLDYGLFQNPARTVIWGDKSGDDTLEVEATGAAQAIPVYGQIPGGQRVRDGTYRDTITVTVYY